MDDIKFPDEQSRQPVAKKKSAFKRFLRRFILLIILVLGIFIRWKYFYAFGKDGVKSGYLNYVVYKGQLFKTYEGKLIQQGVKTQGPGSIQSNEFEFSIKSRRIYDQLKLNSGKFFDLQYRQFNGVVPWRGNTVYLVDSVLSMRDQQ